MWQQSPGMHGIWSAIPVISGDYRWRCSAQLRWQPGWMWICWLKYLWKKKNRKSKNSFKKMSFSSLFWFLTNIRVAITRLHHVDGRSEIREEFSHLWWCSQNNYIIRCSIAYLSSRTEEIILASAVDAIFQCSLQTGGDGKLLFTSLTPSSGRKHILCVCLCIRTGGCYLYLLKRA